MENGFKNQKPEAAHPGHKSLTGDRPQATNDEIIYPGGSSVYTSRQNNSDGARMDNVPQELKDCPQWVCYKLVDKGKKQSDGTPKLDKIPINPHTGKEASSTDPATWSTFEHALEVSKHFDGIGFVFTQDTPFMGVDLDDCITDGELQPWASDIYRRLDSYSEISPSGKGVKIFIKASKPGDRCRTGKIEMYSSGRFFTVTGNMYGSRTTVEDRQAELEAVYVDVFPQKESKPVRIDNLTPLNLSDQDVLEKALKSKHGERFGRLYGGDFSDYPSHSEADLALCCMLAFWTGRDPHRIDSMFRQSGLYRDKWERQDYRERTIEQAINNTTESYDPGKNGRNAIPSFDSEPLPPDPQGAKTYHLTDLGNAERLIDLHGKDLRFCHPWNKWLVWNGQRWIEDNTGEVWRRAIDTSRSMLAEAATITDSSQRKELAQHALKSEGTIKVKAMLTHAQNLASVAVLPEQLDVDPAKLNCINGVIDLTTGKLQPHRREDLLTKQIPVTFDPSAECPQWIAFLNRIMAGNQELISWLQKVAGYTLTGFTREQVFFILYGTGANGKSTFLATIRELLGDYSKRVRTETLMVKKYDQVPTDLADLAGARFVSAVETDEGQRIAESQLKLLTGDSDGIKVRRLYEREFEYTPTYKIFLSANHKPTIRGTDHAIWRRIRLIPFTVTIPEQEQDKDLQGKLRAELPGILNWALQGCIRWQSEGLGHPAEVRQATDEYRNEMDDLAAFLDECCLIGPDYQVKPQELYNAFVTYCENNGLAKISQKRLAQRIVERGFTVTRNAGGRWYIGLTVLKHELGHVGLGGMSDHDAFSGKVQLNSSHEGSFPKKATLPDMEGQSDMETAESPEDNDLITDVLNIFGGEVEEEG